MPPHGRWRHKSRGGLCAPGGPAALSPRAFPARRGLRPVALRPTLSDGVPLSGASKLGTIHANRCSCSLLAEGTIVAAVLRASPDDGDGQDQSHLTIWLAAWQK